ncbi:N-6 DNA Methylase family protein [Niveomyces insectorum RCEF 264]|uniref:N-6 DNA Methylase family protein n=1 Tax=Niveomyces insectorum RCEF 264 TaxID=1081102 RepID=A0A162MEB5_9HYPO|nr:N-6 DNA Methylase family protein [Niveomyces insectorum RCEF 264]
MFCARLPRLSARDAWKRKERPGKPASPVAKPCTGVPKRRASPRREPREEFSTHDDQRPATSDQRPATSDQRPTRATSDQRPATSDQRPATSDQRPATSDQRPATSDQRPADQQTSAVDG